VPLAVNVNASARLPQAAAGAAAAYCGALCTLAGVRSWARFAATLRLSVPAAWWHKVLAWGPLQPLLGELE
jgi:hypothetical protein